MFHTIFERHSFFLVFISFVICPGVLYHVYVFFPSELSSAQKKKEKKNNMRPATAELTARLKSRDRLLQVAPGVKLTTASP